jgi:Na+/melibiose symporter-like transporter
MLDVIGFQEGSPTQTPEVASNLGWVMCIGVILAVGAGIAIFSTCKLKRSEVQEALDKLEAMEKGINDAVVTEEATEEAVEAEENVETVGE